ncbi:MAG: YdcH family protein [Pseudomonadota bacterium]
MDLLERQRLQRDHRHLDEQIKQIMDRPHADPMTIKQLKKQKLALKDRLYRVVPFEREGQNAA